MYASQEMLAHQLKRSLEPGYRLGAQVGLARRDVFRRKAGRCRSSSAILCGPCDFHLKAPSSLYVSLVKEG